MTSLHGEVAEAANAGNSEGRVQTAAQASLKKEKVGQMPGLPSFVAQAVGFSEPLSAQEHAPCAVKSGKFKAILQGGDDGRRAVQFFGYFREGVGGCRRLGRRRRSGRRCYLPHAWPSKSAAKWAVLPTFFTFSRVASRFTSRRLISPLLPRMINSIRLKWSPCFSAKRARPTALS